MLPTLSCWHVLMSVYPQASSADQETHSLLPALTYLAMREKNHEIEKKAPAQPELSSRSDFRACFVVVVRISFDPVTSTILEQDLREF